MFIIFLYRCDLFFSIGNSSGNYLLFRYLPPGREFVQQVTVITSFRDGGHLSGSLRRLPSFNDP
jgi:hypothetical protein